MFVLNLDYSYFCVDARWRRYIIDGFCMLSGSRGAGEELVAMFALPCVVWSNAVSCSGIISYLLSTNYFLLSRLTRWFVAFHFANIRRMCEIYVRNRQFFTFARAKR